MSSDTTSSDPREPRPKRLPPSIADLLISIGIIAAGVGGTWILWIARGGEWFDQPGLATIGWVGALVSLAGVVLAVLIFRRQTRAAKVDGERQQTVLDAIRGTLGDVHSAVRGMVERANAAVADEMDTQDGEEDPWVDDTPVARAQTVYLRSPSGRARRVFEPAEVPLAVIASLVSSWKSMGLNGRWTVGMLRGAFRTEGKGNHPWFLIFVPREGQQVLWRVSRGPGGTDHATVIRSPEELN